MTKILQTIERRGFLKKTGIALSSTLLSPYALSSSPHLHRLHDPDFKGVRVGVITYSFRSMPETAEDLLGYLTDLGIGEIEMMGGPVEEYAGAPKGPPRKRGELTDSERSEREKYRSELQKWRTTVGMEKFKSLGKMYKKAGVNIDIVKFNLTDMSPEEINYCFGVAKTLGARGITLERSDEAIQLLSPYATEYKTLIGYHNHTKVNFNSWDVAVSSSKFNSLNLDVGHYMAGTNQSPIPLIEKYSDRILNLHMKDRKKDNGENMPWGLGDTPLKEVLQLMRDEKYRFMATIELEYPIPDGSDAVKEVRKCLDYCKNAINT